MPTWLLNWRIWAAAGVAGLALAVYVQTLRLSACQADGRAKDAQIQTLGGQIERQNQAIAALEAQGQARTEAATKAAAEFRARATGLAGQVSTLTRALEARKSKPGQPVAGNCPAGDAVKDVRHALAGR